MHHLGSLRQQKIYEVRNIEFRRIQWWGDGGGGGVSLMPGAITLPTCSSDHLHVVQTEAHKHGYDRTSRAVNIEIYHHRKSQQEVVCLVCDHGPDFGGEIK